MANVELDISESMQDMAREREGVLVPDSQALQILADGMKYKLPENPRLLLVEGIQNHYPRHYSIYDFARTGYTPTIQNESDLVVTFRGKELNDLNLTISVARTLLGRRREQANEKSRRISLWVATGGVAIGGAGAAFQNDIIGYVGGGIFVAGMTGVACLADRNDPTVPNVESYAPPIRLLQKA